MQQVIGWIRLLPYDFAPNGWQICDGSQLPIGEYDELFTLIESTFGGDGMNTFAVPDLRGAAPRGCNYCIALRGSYPVGRYENALVGETMVTAFDPDLRDIVECAGQQLPKNRYALLGTVLNDRFGGDGGNFKMPDLRKSAPPNCRYTMATDGDMPSGSGGRRQAFVGELVLLPTDTAPEVYTPCDGKLLEIKQHQALFSLIGKKFGGDGQQNFALPDLRSAAPAKFNYFIALRGLLGR